MRATNKQTPCKGSLKGSTVRCMYLTKNSIIAIIKIGILIAIIVIVIVMVIVIVIVIVTVIVVVIAIAASILIARLLISF